MRDVLNSKGVEAITSDQWHVVHSRFMAGPGPFHFLRGISSEHVARADCLKAARALHARLRAESAAVPRAERDQVFVRRPRYKSLKRARRRKSRPK